ncbi:anamorsin homolog [Topomyia yanbarensis]|uniref:anamorsin homolog n=1 Tax=Topomyia yanbarensis TaxID=2498891 RepID=UPI00273B4EF7|nr:anamorsin homolog [Topomyia yanbarensis]XP_058819464.1 anamorsin homolog [Topomyia yanbarensis]
MNFVQEHNQVLYVWSGALSTGIEQEVNQLKTVPNVRVNVENADRVQLADYEQSQFDVILANVPTGNSQLVCHLLKLVKPKGKVVFKDDSANTDAARSNLLLSGFINITSIEGNVYVGEKPNYEVGSATKLSFAANKAKVAAVWKLDVDEEDDQIDADELLDDEDKIKPTAESLRVCGTTGKRKACKDCSCGLAEELEAETKGSASQSTAIKSSCGSCYLGDAFRCATCPYLGMPAFKPGEKIQLSDTQMQADV